MSREELLSHAEFWLVNFQVLISEELAAFQKRNGLSRAELSAELGFPSRFITHALKGDIDCRISKLAELSVKIGLAPEICFVPLLMTTNASGTRGGFTVNPELDKIDIKNAFPRFA